MLVGYAVAEENQCDFSLVHLSGQPALDNHNSNNESNKLLASVSRFSCITPISNQSEQLPEALNAVLKASPILIFSVMISKTSGVEVKMT